jgi:acylphosphatase
MVRHVDIHVSGRVQGVFFRATAKEVASSLGLCGFVRNEQDGSVYIEAEGEIEKLDSFLDWCRKGPPRAAVSNVDITDGEMRGFKEFAIRRG